MKAITVAFLLVQAFCYAMSTEDEDNRKKFIPILHGAPSEFIEHCRWADVLGSGRKRLTKRLGG